MKKILIASISAAALCGAAHAQDIDATGAAEATANVGAHADTALDALSVVTKEDAKAYAKTEFALIDANADGKVEKGEYLSAAKMASAATQTVDGAVDGAVGAADSVVGSATGVVGGVAGGITGSGVTGDGEVMAEGDIESETAAQQFIGLTKNGKALTEKQLIDARLADFKAADLDGNGKLEAEEQASFAASVKLGAAS